MRPQWFLIVAAALGVWALILAWGFLAPEAPIETALRAAAVVGCVALAAVLALSAKAQGR